MFISLKEKMNSIYSDSILPVQHSISVLNHPENTNRALEQFDGLDNDSWSIHDISLRSISDTSKSCSDSDCSFEGCKNIRTATHFCDYVMPIYASAPSIAATERNSKSKSQDDNEHCSNTHAESTRQQQNMLRRMDPRFNEIRLAIYGKPPPVQAQSYHHAAENYALFGKFNG